MEVSIGWATWKLFAIMKRAVSENLWKGTQMGKCHRVSKRESDKVEITRVDNSNKSRRPFENVLLWKGNYERAEDDYKGVIIMMDSGILTGLKGK